MMHIVVIKLGAAGDVVRTLPLIKSIKKNNPSSNITLITKKDVDTVLKGISYIDSILTPPLTKLPQADVLYNFDIDSEALSLANAISAPLKKGFYGSEGYPLASNPGAEYYLNTVFDDDLKRNNKKTYQEMMFEAAELPINKEPYELILSSQEKKKAKEFIKKEGIDSTRLVGIHMGSSDRWPSKRWSKEKLKEFIKKANSKNYQFLLFGGPNEMKEHQDLSQELKSEGVIFFHNNPHNTKREFLALLNECQAVICSDSFALHVAIGLHKPTIGLFFCTSPDEVEPYTFLTKITSPLLYKYFPEKSNVFDETLVSSISPSDVLTALEKCFHRRYK